MWINFRLQSLRYGLDPGQVCFSFVVEKVTVGRDFVRVSLFLPAIATLEMLRSHHYLHATFIIRTSGRSIETHR
jgi:hypothetical protein